MVAWVLESNVSARSLSVKVCRFRWLILGVTGSDWVGETGIDRKPRPVGPPPKKLLASCLLF